MKKTTFVFSPLEDFIVFVLPIIVAFSVHDFFSVHFRALAYMFLFKTVIQSGHLFLTAFPYMERKDGQFKYYAALYVAIYVVVNLISTDYFFNVFSVASAFHIINQHYGWYKKSENEGEFFGKKNLLKYSVFAILIIWFLNLFPSSPGYVYPFKVFDFVKDIYQIPLYIRLTLVSVMFGITMYLIFARKKLIDRPLFFLGTFGWITCGILLENEQSNYFFSVYAVISHGLGYTLFMMRKWPNRLTAPGKLSLNMKAIMLATAGVLGYLQIIIFSPFKEILGNQLIVITWIPSIIHFAADSYLWKSKRMSTMVHAEDNLPLRQEESYVMNAGAAVRTSIET